MNRSAVMVDASVAAKWVLVAEDHAAEALLLLTECLRHDRPLVGPPHLHGEVSNALYQRVRSTDPGKQLMPDEAAEALAVFLALPLTPVVPPTLYERAFDLAQALNLPSLYDALYVVAAQLLGVELWTADRRLLTALGPAAPWVHFIGDYAAPDR
jgi:predicted nucleic acid-binding protein